MVIEWFMSGYELVMNVATSGYRVVIRNYW